MNICCCCSVTKSCLTHCDSMDFSRPWLPFLHYLCSKILIKVLNMGWCFPLREKEEEETYNDYTTGFHPDY